MHKVTILSVNMHRRNAAMHALLNLNESDQILCIQEPWFCKISTAHSDKDREGVDVLGGATHPSWSLIYPYFTQDKHAKVMIYVCKQHTNRLTPL